MADESVVEQLLERLLDSQGTPESVCSSYPELLPHVRERWRQMCHARADLDAIFPPAAERNTMLAATGPTGIPLPVIPGYEVESVLGVGGIGVVFRARHLKLNRVVALKMALAGAYASPHERARFQREAEAVAALTHPNVVQIYDVGESDGRPYFTMEYAEAGSLAGKLAATPQPVRQAAALLATLAGAVQVAHASGIVHRDLKPANVLLTADGTPKITDFGLARRVDGEAGLTRTGALIGTPSYMAPEQARGQAAAVGPATDIYALGAILYELLTGRPPFRADSSSATLQQVVSSEPVPPSRLNASVARDLETICLKCLQKDPGRRYTSAADLRDDVQRFLRDEPIVARPIGLPGRVVRWARRSPTGAALLLTALGLFCVTTIFVTKEFALASQRRLERAQWQERLQFVLQLEHEGRFEEARVILGRVPDGGSGHLRGEIESAIRDLGLAERLEALRMNRGQFKPGVGMDYDEDSREYERFFRDTGLGVLRDDSALEIRREEPEVVAKRLNASTTRAALIAALDDWALYASREQRAWILSVARHMDPDPWRDRVRRQEHWENLDELARLAEEANVREQPVNLMVALGIRWRRLGGRGAKNFLLKVYQLHPNDFWLNFELGMHFQGDDDPTAVSYYRTAVALRPDAPWAHYYLGGNLADMGKSDDAIHHLQRTVALDPNNGWAQSRLGDLLLAKGMVEQSLTHLEAAADLIPDWPVPKIRLQEVLLRLGRVKEAGANWARALDHDASTYPECDGYAELCLLLGREDDYRTVCDLLLVRFGSISDPRECELLGRACLLAPPTDRHLQQAVALIDRALAADRSTYPNWLYPYFRFAKGLAEYRSGHYQSAIAICEGEAANVLGPAPELVTALAQHRLGNQDAARQALAKANEEFDGEGDPVRQRDTWLYFILRREALKQIDSIGE